jgi:hypothetical protein
VAWLIDYPREAISAEIVHISLIFTASCCLMAQLSGREADGITIEKPRMAL